MIDPKVFGGWMAALAERFGRELGEASSKAYHAILSRQLTTQQFDLAAAVIFGRFEYKGSWPAPELFVEAAKPTADVALDAGAVLRQVRGLLRAEGYAITAAPEYHALPEYVQRAVGAVGGFDRIHNGTLEQEPFLLRDFGKALAQAKDHHERAAIAGVLPSQADVQVRQLVGSVAKQLSGPRDVHGRPLERPELSDEQRAELAAAAEWGAAHPNAEKVIRARLRGMAPKSGGVDESDEAFRQMFEAARLRAFREWKQHHPESTLAMVGGQDATA